MQNRINYIIIKGIDRVIRSYKFLDFELDSTQRTLFKAHTRVAIGPMAYQILLFFVQNAGVNLSREQLIQQVWQDKFISDATLYKQIQRLRQCLDDTSEKKRIIGTVHGVGFIFLPEITHPETVVVPKKPRKSYLKFSFFALLMIFLFYQLFVGNTDFNKLAIPITNDAHAMAPRIAIIPDFLQINGNNQHPLWMANGGVHYLYEMFKTTSDVNVKRYTSKHILDLPSEHFAISLSNKKQTDTSIIVTINNINDMFHSNVKIREQQGVIATQTFSSESIKSLLNDIFQWSQSTLNLKIPKSAETTTMSTNSYAVENYIRGMSAQFTGDSGKAIKFFELATLEDSQFWLAWYELTISHRKQGNYQKSLAIISSLETAPIAESLTLKLLNSKVNLLYRLGKHKRALEIADEGIELAIQYNNKFTQASLLTNKSFIAADLGQLELAKESIDLSMQIKSKHFSQDYSSLGSTYNTLSGIEIRMNDLPSAKKHAQLAIDYFGKSSDDRYKAVAQSRMAFILFRLGDSEGAEKIYEQLIEIHQNLNNTTGEIGSLMGLIQIQIQKGDFHRATQSNDRILNLLDNSNNNTTKASYIATQAKLMLLKNELVFAKSLIDQIQEFDFNGSDIIYHDLLLKYYEKSKLHNRWRILAENYVDDHDLDENPFVYCLKAKLFIENNDNQLAQTAFEQARTLAIETNNSLVISETLLSYTKFLLRNNNLSDANQVMQQLATHNPANYPFLKYKAAILMQQGNVLAAHAALTELKNTSGDHWKIDDQLLLERYTTKLSSSGL